MELPIIIASEASGFGQGSYPSVNGDDAPDGVSPIRPEIDGCSLAIPAEAGHAVPCPLFEPDD